MKRGMHGSGWRKNAPEQNNPLQKPRGVQSGRSVGLPYTTSPLPVNTSLCTRECDVGDEPAVFRRKSDPAKGFFQIRNQLKNPFGFPFDPPPEDLRISGPGKKPPPPEGQCQFRVGGYGLLHGACHAIHPACVHISQKTQGQVEVLQAGQAQRKPRSLEMAPLSCQNRLHGFRQRSGNEQAEGRHPQAPTNTRPMPSTMRA